MLSAVTSPRKVKSPKMRSILVTGSNRGLGLGLIRHLTKRPGTAKIFATCRNAAKAEELQEIAEKSGKVHIIEIDLLDSKNYKIIVDKVEREVGDKGLNVLFNNAGVSSKFTRLGIVKESQIIEAFQINTVAPILLTKALLPLLKKAAKYSQLNGLSIEKAAVINMTSVLGSITENETGGFYPYRCSKAALNAATKSMSLDLKPDHILVTCIHPGWVKTDLGGSNAPMDVNSSVTAILNTLESLSEKHNGCFLQYDGQFLPW
ncbi:C-signal [Prorops nasuta]|uniref:C-signal n=1 Tax=Prorops nasuta TaxID=863751 RepID=UPI0034CD4491